MATKLGMKGKLYRNTGTYGQPTWNEIANVRELTLSLETGESDATTRANNGWRATVATLKEATIEFEMVWDPGDANFTALRTAFLNNSSIELAVLDGVVTETGTQGLRATCMITSFSRNEPLEEVMTVSVTAKPTYSENAPEWMTVS